MRTLFLQHQSTEFQDSGNGSLPGAHTAPAAFRYPITTLRGSKTMRAAFLLGLVITACMKVSHAQVAGEGRWMIDEAPRIKGDTTDTMVGEYGAADIPMLGAYTQTLAAIPATSSRSDATRSAPSPFHDERRYSRHVGLILCGQGVESFQYESLPQQRFRTGISAIRSCCLPTAGRSATAPSPSGCTGC